MHIRLDGTLAAASECLFAAVSTNQTSTQEQLQASLRQAVKIKQTSASVQRSTFKAVAEVFGRFEKHSIGSTAEAGATAELLKPILFGAEVGSEAIRLQRAEALAAIATAAPKVAGNLRAVVEASVKQERSATVRDRLLACLATLQQ